MHHSIGVGGFSGSGTVSVRCVVRFFGVFALITCVCRRFVILRGAGCGKGATGIVMSTIFSAFVTARVTEKIEYDIIKICTKMFTWIVHKNSASLTCKSSRSLETTQIVFMFSALKGYVISSLHIALAMFI